MKPTQRRQLRQILGLMLMAALMVAPLSAYAQSASRVDVEVKKGQIQVDPVLPEEALQTSYEGELYTIPQPVPLGVAAHKQGIHGLISQMVIYNAKGDPQQMAELFAPAERSRIANSFENPALIEANVTFFKEVKEARIEGYVKHKGVTYYLVAFDEGGNKRMIVPTVKTDEGYFLANKAADIQVLSELVAAYPKGQIQPAK